MKIAGIYRILQIETGKCYIGSSNHLRKRMWTHTSRLRKGTHENRFLQNAWNLYGENAFASEIVLLCRVTDLFLYEALVVSAYRSNEKEFGYNLRLIVESNHGMPSSKMLHLVGDKHNLLTLLEIVERRDGKVFGRYRCDCGNEHVAQAGSVKRGGSKSCGCLLVKHMQTSRARSPGEKFHRLTLIEPVERNAHGAVRWRCKCDCGNETTTMGSLVTRGITKSCGCLRTEMLLARTLARKILFHAKQTV